MESTEVIWFHQTGQPVPSEVSWHDSAPLEISIIFYDKQVAPWKFSRDMLADALELGFAGEEHGDVRMYCHAGTLYLTLSSHEGTAVIETKAAPLNGFLYLTYALSPREEESLNFDDELDRLLGWE